MLSPCVQEKIALLSPDCSTFFHCLHYLLLLSSFIFSRRKMGEMTLSKRGTPCHEEWPCAGPQTTTRSPPPNKISSAAGDQRWRWSWRAGTFTWRKWNRGCTNSTKEMTSTTQGMAFTNTVKINLSAHGTPFSRVTSLQDPLVRTLDPWLPSFSFVLPSSSPLRLVLALDVSRQMSKAWTKTRDAAFRLISHLPLGSELAIVTFDAGAAVSLKPTVVRQVRVPPKIFFPQLLISPLM